MLATPGKLSPPPTTIPQRRRAARPLPRLALSFPCTLAVAISLPLVCPASEVALPLPCTPFRFRLPHATVYPLPPQPPSSKWRWRVALGTLEARRHCLPSPARSSSGLRARLRRGLIITPTDPQPHWDSLTLGEEGRGQLARWGPWLGLNQPLRSFQRQVPFPVPQRLSHPFLFLLSPLFHSSPWSGLSPLSHLRSGFGRLTAGPGRTNFLCLEPNWTGFPSPSLHQRASSSQRFWPTGPKATAPEATINPGVAGGGVILTDSLAVAVVQWDKGCKKWEWKSGRKETESRVMNMDRVWYRQWKEKKSEREEHRKESSEESSSYLYRVEVGWKKPPPALPKCPNPSLPSLWMVRGSES